MDRIAVGIIGLTEYVALKIVSPALWSARTLSKSGARATYMPSVDYL